MPTFNIAAEIIFPGLVHFQFDTQYEVSSTFLRLQEFYESPYPLIRGKRFDLEEYMDTYAADKGNFTYTSDWSGFNVPGHIVDEFMDVYGEHMLTKEYVLFDAIANNTGEWEKYYIIASSKDGGKKNNPLEVMKHEVAHGMFYLVPEYQKEMTTIAEKVDKKHPELGQKLKDMGYCDEVILDELQAYFAASTMTYLADSGFEGCDIPWNSVLEVQRIFEKYYEELTEKDEK